MVSNIGRVMLPALIFLAAGTPGVAGPLTWQISATFQITPFFPDQRTLTGSFQFDAQTGAFSSISLTASAGTGFQLATFTVPVSDPQNPTSATFLYFTTSQADPAGRYFFNLLLPSPMLAGGGTILFGGGTGGEGILCSDGHSVCASDGVASGSLTAVATGSTPEPASLALMMFGALALGGAVQPAPRSAARTATLDRLIALVAAGRTAKETSADNPTPHGTLQARGRPRQHGDTEAVTRHRRARLDQQADVGGESVDRG